MRERACAYACKQSEHLHHTGTRAFCKVKKEKRRNLMDISFQLHFKVIHSISIIFFFLKTVFTFLRVSTGENLQQGVIAQSHRSTVYLVYRLSFIVVVSFSRYIYEHDREKEAKEKKNENEIILAPRAPFAIYLSMNIFQLIIFTLRLCCYHQSSLFHRDFRLATNSTNIHIHVRAYSCTHTRTQTNLFFFT